MNIHQLYSNAQAMYYLDLPHTSMEQSQNYLEEILLKNDKSPRHLWELAVELADTREFIGMVCLEPETSWLKEGRAD